MKIHYCRCKSFIVIVSLLFYLYCFYLNTDIYFRAFAEPLHVYVRDTLSYLVLLGLHFAICLTPGSLPFSDVEWTIFIFFLGRIVMELSQFLSTNASLKKKWLQYVR